MSMNPEIKALWLTALRSGSYTQGHGYLRQAYPSGNDRYCCLGVLCDIAQRHNKITPPEPDYEPTPLNPNPPFRYGDAEAYLPDVVADWATLDANPHVDVCPNYRDAEELAELNDLGFTFDQIADLIERFM
jgi:hypothetical protein